jgi:hypothetical protein
MFRLQAINDLGVIAAGPNLAHGGCDKKKDRPEDGPN